MGMIGGLDGVSWDGNDVGWEMREMREMRARQTTMAWAGMAWVGDGVG